MNRKGKHSLTSHLDHHYLSAAELFATGPNRAKRRVMVYVEGYDDISFWRAVLQPYENEKLYFEINVPTRSDLAKGKRVLLSMLNNLGENMVLCMDSDFDYLFQGATEQSYMVLSSPYIIHTYAYSIENHLCYAASLREIAVKATKNDLPFFDFEKFIADYSSAIFPAFLWYAYSALISEEHLFVLTEYRNCVKFHFVELANNGAETINWIKRSVSRKIQRLESENPEKTELVKEFGRKITHLGVTRTNCYMYMNGHTLFEITSTLLQGVCEVLKRNKLEVIKGSDRRGVTLENELSNYKNTLRNPEQLLHDSSPLNNSPLMEAVKRDIALKLKLNN